MSNSTHDKRWTKIKNNNISVAANTLAHRFHPYSYVKLTQEQIDGLNKGHEFIVDLSGSFGRMKLTKRCDKLIGSYR